MPSKGARLAAAKQFYGLLFEEDRVCFDQTALTGVRLLSLDDGLCVCELKVEEKHTNRYGTLHGGCTATLADSLTTVALVAATGSAVQSGVSVNLAVTYLTPMPVGEVVEATAKVIKLGQRLSTITCDFRRVKTGALVATAVHTKFLQPAAETSADSTQRAKNASSDDALQEKLLAVRSRL